MNQPPKLQIAPGKQKLSVCLRENAKKFKTFPMVWKGVNFYYIFEQTSQFANINFRIANVTPSLSLFNLQRNELEYFAVKETCFYVSSNNFIADQMRTVDRHLFQLQIVYLQYMRFGYKYDCDVSLIKIIF